MTRTPAIRLLALAAALLAAAYCLAPSTPPAARAQPPRPAAKWEYLTIAVYSNGSVAVRGAGVAARGGDWKTVAEQYKLPAEPMDSEENRFRVLNHLGSLGWELATHTTTTAVVTIGGSTVERYTFKRPAP